MTVNTSDADLITYDAALIHRCAHEKKNILRSKIRSYKTKKKYTLIL